jgi:hypothetical protein
MGTENTSVEISVVVPCYNEGESLFYQEGGEHGVK